MTFIHDGSGLGFGLVAKDCLRYCCLLNLLIRHPFFIHWLFIDFFLSFLALNHHWLTLFLDFDILF